MNASPFLSQYVSQENARKHANKYPLAAETVLQSMYMDDSMDSVENGIELYKQLHKLWSLAGMNAKKWLSNSKVVLDNIPIKNRASEIDLSKDELPMVKMLGVLWIAEQDHFTFHYSSPQTESHWTKRSILKKIATLFDPLGFLNPYTVRAKMIMQQLWLSGVDWDEDIAPECSMQIRTWFQELPDLKDICIP